MQLHQFQASLFMEPGGARSLVFWIITWSHTDGLFATLVKGTIRSALENCTPLPQGAAWQDEALARDGVSRVPESAQIHVQQVGDAIQPSHPLSSPFPPAFNLSAYFSLSCTGEGNGSPLQCSCLENPRDGGAWWAAVCGVTQSRDRKSVV